VYMDQNGDAEGNYTVVARKSHHISPQQYGLYPVGVFTLKEDDSRLLVSTRSLHFGRFSLTGENSKPLLFLHLVSGLHAALISLGF
jgi:hypothetical protein